MMVVSNTMPVPDLQDYYITVICYTTATVEKHRPTTY